MSIVNKDAFIVQNSSFDYTKGVTQPIGKYGIVHFLLMVNECAFLANADWTNVLSVSKVVQADWTNVLTFESS